MKWCLMKMTFPTMNSIPILVMIRKKNSKKKKTSMTMTAPVG